MAIRLVSDPLDGSMCGAGAIRFGAEAVKDVAWHTAMIAVVDLNILNTKMIITNYQNINIIKI